MKYATSLFLIADLCFVCVCVCVLTVHLLIYVQIKIITLPFFLSLVHVLEVLASKIICDTLFTKTHF